jgi:type VI protein secretion system component VasF
MEISQYWGKGANAWTQLPQAFSNLLTIFGTALTSNLKAFSANQNGCTFFQYIDDFLLAGPTQEDCMEGIHLLLSLLWEAAYKVSRKKAQIFQNTVKYLSFHLSQGQ